MRTVEVLDPFDAVSDPALPTIALALDVREAQHQIGRRLPQLATGGGAPTLRAIRVTRHKPGKRCLIEYDLDVSRPGEPTSHLTLIGKIRHRRFGKEGYRLLASFWDAGFDAHSADRISVPRPVGTLARFQMWLQQKVAGASTTEMLTRSDGVRLAGRIAEAAHKVHGAGVPTEQRHTIADEMRILHDCLGTVRATHPRLAPRIDAVLAGCDRLAGAIPSAPPAGIHRDFYADQVIVDAGRVYLIDFDLYCIGDPALDIGNFIGHLTEQSLRCFRRPDALADREAALADRFVELSGRDLRGSISAYATLTLARHVYLSTQFAERRPFTEALLALCEERLAAGSVDRRRAARCA